MQVRIGDRVIETVDIITMRQVDKKEISDYLLEILSKYDTIIENIFN